MTKLIAHFELTQVMLLGTDPIEHVFAETEAHAQFRIHLKFIAEKICYFIRLMLGTVLNRLSVRFARHMLRYDRL